MNPIAEEILMHYGMPRRSGRYPWGSGENPYQHSGDFLSRIDELKSQGMSDTEIAKAMGLTTTQYRTQKSLAKDERRALDVARAKSLREDGLSLNEIAKEMGFANDSSVRSLLNENSEVRMNQAKTTAEFIKKQIDEKGMIDVGAGVERELGISKEKLNEALYMLEMEGYPVYGGRVDQITNPGKKTTLRVICPPGTEHKEIYDFENINSLKDYVSHDDGETFDPKFVYPKSMDSKRLQIRYSEDGGELKDGVVEIRRGVDDLSLGESHYAQVRILVDGSHYIKGMAVYSDDLPDGVDVMFNTNKKKGTPKMDVLKPIKDDPDNPFGSLIKEGVNDPDNPTSVKGGQSYYYDKNGKKQLSLINKRAEEGDWGEWADKLPSQFLSKQSRTLIKKQLNLAAADKQSEFDEICSLTNPTVKKALLKSFADDCDAAAVHLQAAALPRQKYQVILPLTSIKDNEVYAPNYKNGETVALVRYPHGGTFEIPVLTVNNKQAEGRRVLGNTPADAIGINKKVADRLSGADFDGDTVMVIPCNSSNSRVKITSTPQLKGLEGFDPKMAYGTVKKGGDYYNESGQKIKITNIVSGCLTAIRNKYGEFTSTGTQTMVKLIAGVRSQDSSARMAFTNIISACLTVIKNKYAEFTSTGRECMVKFIAGVRSKDGELRTAFTTTLSGAITSIKDYYGEFKSAGSYLVDGFCNGISENTWKAEAKARAMAAAAAEAAEDELDEHSPSKRFYGIGNFAGVGFINALIDNVSKAGKAGREIAKSSIDGLNDVISRIADYVDADMDVQPTIRPVLDLSAVEAGTGRLNTLFSRNQALSVSTGMNERISEMEVQNGESSSAGNTYQFTQNNYSPKALSRIDIYRQTKNQFSAMKGLVSNT